MPLRASERESERIAARRSRFSTHSNSSVLDGRDLGDAELLGAGGSSRVWRVVDSTGMPIALKTLHPALRGPGARALLEHEYAMLTELTHPHVVAALGLVEWRGAAALAMQYLGGGDLVSLAGGHPRTWIGAVRSVVAALAHLHAHGIAHRDLKARNVLCDERDQAYLVDFASAAPFGTRAPRGGTTAAVRPAADSSVVGPVEDRFALAALVYELMAGRPPFAQARPRAGQSVPPPRTGPVAGPALAALAELVMSTLHTDPAKASGSLSELADVIESVVAGYG